MGKKLLLEPVEIFGREMLRAPAGSGSDHAEMLPAASLKEVHLGHEPVKPCSWIWHSNRNEQDVRPEGLNKPAGHFNVPRFFVRVASHHECSFQNLYARIPGLPECANGLFNGNSLLQEIEDPLASRLHAKGNFPASRALHLLEKLPVHRIHPGITAPGEGTHPAETREQIGHPVSLQGEGVILEPGL